MAFEIGNATISYFCGLSFFHLFFGGAFIKLLFCFQLVSSELGIATNLPFFFFWSFFVLILFLVGLPKSSFSVSN